MNTSIDLEVLRNYLGEKDLIILSLQSEIKSLKEKLKNFEIKE